MFHTCKNYWQSKSVHANLSVFWQVGCTVMFFVKGISLCAMLYMQRSYCLCRCTNNNLSPFVLW